MLKLISSRLCCRGAAVVAASGVGAAAASSASSSTSVADKPRCKPIVLCGPSGAGKSTLINMLRKEFPSSYGFSVSHTTRDPRPGEKHCVDYYYVSKEQMEQEIAAGKFLETAHVHGNIYGTSFEAVKSVADQGRICILDIDIQGVRSCRNAGFEVDRYIFIAPPSLETLEQRLRGRGTETEERIQKRLAGAVGEMEGSKSMEWDGYIVNDDVEAAYVKLRELTAPGREVASKAQAAVAAQA